MSKQNKGKEKAKKNKFLRIAVIAIIAYSIVLIASLEIEVMNKRSELDAKKQQQAELQIETDELSRLLEDENQEEYLKKIAREEGYANPEDRILVDISGN